MINVAGSVAFFAIINQKKKKYLDFILGAWPQVK
jgi:hypothetical protein